MRIKTIFTFITIGMLAMLVMSGCSGSSKSSGSKPGAPTNLVATPADSQVTLQWNASKGATSYNVYDATVSGGPYTRTGTTTATNYTVKGLTNGTKYYFVVTAVNNAGESGYSNEANKTPEPATTKPNPPANLIAVAGDTKVALTWNASVGATNYNVYESTTSGSGYIEITTTTDLNYTVTGLTDGTGYYFVVTAVNSIGESGYSNEASATPAKPGPNNLTAIAGDTQALLGWNTYNVGSWPDGIAIDASGNVWVANWGNNTVTELSPTGATITTVTVGTNTVDIAIDGSGDIWLAGYNNNTVIELSPAGTLITTVTVGINPYGIAIDASGNIWVSNMGDNTVTKLSHAGTFITTVTVG